MSGVYLVIILAALLLFILSLTRLSLRLQYCRIGKDDEVKLEFSVWRGLLRYKLEIPVVEMRVKKPKLKPRPRPLWPIPRPVFKIKAEIKGEGGRPIAEEKKKVRVPGPAKMVKILINYVRLAKKYSPAVMYLLHRVHLHRLRWRTEIGAGDPAHTGFLTGAVWGVKGFLLNTACCLLSPDGVRPLVSVSPNFERVGFRTALDCIFEVRFGYIILTGIRALIIKLK